MHEEITSFPRAEENDDLLRIYIAGISYCDGSYKIRRKNSDHYVFEYVIKGRGYLETDNYHCEPKAGDIYIVHEGSDHQYGSSADAPWEKIWFNVSGKLIKELMSLYGIEKVWHVPDCPMKDEFFAALEELKQNPEDANTRGAIIMHRIIQGIATHINLNREQKFSPEALKLKAYLETNVNKQLSLDDMAKYICKSPSQTVRIFKKNWGITPYQYLLEKRIELAKLFLQNTAKPIKEIAMDLDFADEYYFSNIFKKKTGLPPRAYRRR